MFLEKVILLSPEFEKIHKEHLEYNQEELRYVLLGEICAYLIENHYSKTDKLLIRTFDLIDKELTLTDNEEITIGFIETFQNIMKDKVDGYLVYEIMKPNTKLWWDNVNDLWNGKIKFLGEGIDSMKI